MPVIFSKSGNGTIEPQEEGSRSKCLDAFLGAWVASQDPPKHGLKSSECNRTLGVVSTVIN